MLEKRKYANGQDVYKLSGDRLTYFFKTGELKAFGDFIDEKMCGKWTFYRETGQLWQIGHFENNQKHGHFIRYNRQDEVEYDEEFDSGKLIKKKKTK